MNNFQSAAKIILLEAHRPLHYKEITRLAVEKGILKTEGVTPDASMNSIIGTDIKKKGAASDFIKTGNGEYAINPNKMEAAFMF